LPSMISGVWMRRKLLAYLKVFVMTSCKENVAFQTVL